MARSRHSAEQCDASDCGTTGRSTKFASSFDTPLLELVFRAADGPPRSITIRAEVQVCKLISIKTGGCPEDCSYCSQSSRYQTEVKPSPADGSEEVLEIARQAKAAGVSRVCMGAAWREVRDNKQFDRVLDMVRDVAGAGRGSLLHARACSPKTRPSGSRTAGLYAYNHNLDTSESSTRRSSPRAPTPTGWTRSRTSARPTSPSAPAGSSGSARADADRIVDAAHAGDDEAAPRVGAGERAGEGARHAAGRRARRARSSRRCG